MAEPDAGTILLSGNCIFHGEMDMQKAGGRREDGHKPLQPKWQRPWQVTLG